MHLPKVYQYFSDNFPDIIKSYNQLGKTCRESGPLDPKTQNLVNLGIAIGASSRGGHHVPYPQSPGSRRHA